MRKWLAELVSISYRRRKEKGDAEDGPNSAGLWHGHPAYLYNLVFLGFVDLASQAAAGDGVMDNELVGLKTWLLVQLRTCRTRPFSMCANIELHSLCLLELCKWKRVPLTCVFWN